MYGGRENTSRLYHFALPNDQSSNKRMVVTGLLDRADTDDQSNTSAHQTNQFAYSSLVTNYIVFSCSAVEQYVLDVLYFSNQRSCWWHFVRGEGWFPFLKAEAKTLERVLAVLHFDTFSLIHELSTGKTILTTEYYFCRFKTFSDCLHNNNNLNK